MKKIVLLSLLCILSSAIYAQWQSGNDLVRLWKAYQKAGQEYFSMGAYSGYITGVMDANSTVDFIMRQTNYGAGNIQYEIPGNVTIGQVCSIVGKWLDNNPEKWNYAASILVTIALQEAFPIIKSY
jgi:hypothetical protein